MNPRKRLVVSEVRVCLDAHETRRKGLRNTLKATGAQVVSKQRVADHGEVLTGSSEVIAMLDLVKQETERIDSKFLEPACGTGNFLTEILERKLRIVKSRYGKNKWDSERYAVLAVSSIYGIDLLLDNVEKCRQRLFDVFDRQYQLLYRQECLRTIKFILSKNIIHGDALTLMTVGENPKPIVFSEWSFVTGSMMKRREFTFEELLTFAGTKQTPLFSDLGEEVFSPTPFRDYPLRHFLEVADAE